MPDIQTLRHELDGIDGEIVLLLEKRLEAARQVAAYKKERNLPVLDAAREKQVLEDRAGRLKEDYLRPHLKRVFEEIMAMSRAEQERVLKAQTEERHV